jgi:hypothetical protein
LNILAPIWHRKWAVLDQLSFNATNFILNLLLVSDVGFSGFGLFALLVSISAGIQSLLAGIFLEPITIFGSGREGSRYRYAGTIYTLFFSLAGIVLVFFASPFVLAGQTSLVLFAVATAVHALGYSAFGLSRRLFYLRNQSKRAFLLSCAYSLLVLMLVIALRSSERYSELSALCIMGGVSSIVGLVHWAGIKRLFGKAIRCSQKVMAKTDRYRKWSVAAVLPGVVSTQSVFWFGSIFASLEAIGVLRLVLQFGVPIVQFVTSLNSFELVRVSEKFSVLSVTEFTREIAGLRRFYLLIGGTYLLVVFPAAVFGLQYFGDFQIQIGFLVMMVFAAIFVQIDNISRNIVAKASRNSRAVFWSHIFASIGIAGVAPSSIWIGTWGLAVAMFIGAVLYAVTMRLQIRRSNYTT